MLAKLLVDQIAPSHSCRTSNLVEG